MKRTEDNYTHKLELEPEIRFEILDGDLRCYTSPNTVQVIPLKDIRAIETRFSKLTLK